MMKQLRRVGFGLFATLAILACAGHAPAAAQARFEVTSVKAVRPHLVNTVTAIQQRDVAKARAAFEAYDSAWNGIEVYIATRSRPLYQALEIELQARITKGLESPNPDMAALLADAQAILGKYDEAISLIEKAAPLNPLYDDIARLRIVRAHLREVPPALKVGNFAKARKSFEEFDRTWDSIEDLIKAKSADAYVAIEKGMIEIEQALMPDKPDVAKVMALVTAVMTQYNTQLAEIVKDARARP